jgi:hypothetical protein
MLPADLVAVSFSEPQRAVRPRRDEKGGAIGRGDRDFENPSGGRDAADLVAGLFGEPQRAVRPRRDAIGLATGRGDREFGNDLRRRLLSDAHGRPEQDHHHE